MARILDEFPSRSKYPWDEWMDGKVRVAKRGVDFEADLEPANFRSSLTSQAARHGMGCRTKVSGDEVTFQFIPLDKSGRRKKTKR